MQPLLRMILIPYSFEKRVTRKQLQKDVKKSLKLFLGFKPKVRDIFLDKFVRIDLDEWASNLKDIAKWKWECHLKNDILSNKPVPYKIIDNTRFLPKQIVSIVNSDACWCRQCKCRCTSEHLNKRHFTNCPSMEMTIDKAILSARTYKGKHRDGINFIKGLVEKDVISYITAVKTLKESVNPQYPS